VPPRAETTPFSRGGGPDESEAKTRSVSDIKTETIRLKRRSDYTIFRPKSNAMDTPGNDDSP